MHLLFIGALSLGGFLSMGETWESSAITLQCWQALGCSPHDTQRALAVCLSVEANEARGRRAEPDAWISQLFP